MATCPQTSGLPSGPRQLWKNCRRDVILPYFCKPTLSTIPELEKVIAACVLRELGEGKETRGCKLQYATGETRGYFGLFLKI
jgi:hypothetical protein